MRDAHVAGPRRRQDTGRCPLVIYYGSQTGTAEGFAGVLASEAQRHGFAARVVDLETFEADALQRQGAALFVMATYGEGDPTDNAVGFMEWLGEREEEGTTGVLGQVRGAAAPPPPLPPHPRPRPTHLTPSQLSFSVFGLGNTQYENFNATGRACNRLLAQLGGRAVYQYGEGDDSGSLEEDFEAWKEGLWPALKQQVLGLSAAEAEAEVEAEGPPPRPVFPLEVVPISVGRDARAPTPDRVGADVRLDLASRHLFEAREVPVIRNVELRAPGAEGSTRHLELDIAAAGLAYSAADTLGVCPQNEAALVEAVAGVLGYRLDEWFTLRPTAEASEASEAAAAGGGAESKDEAGASRAGYKPIFPTPCTVRKALESYCDLTAQPKRPMLALLAHVASDPAEVRGWGCSASRVA